MTAKPPPRGVLPYRDDVLAVPHAHAPAYRVEFRMRFSPTARGARLARRLTAVRLDQWGFPYDSDASHTTALIVSELATNAVTHGHSAGRDFGLRLAFLTGKATRTLRIEVSDGAGRAGLPKMVSAPEATVETGRGLLLVTALASRWGCTEHAPGTTSEKTVWAELEVN